MEFLIFKTDIQTVDKLHVVKRLFNNHLGALRWNVDMEDIDNVLRIESHENLQETEIITLVQSQGLCCEELID
jgi:hypothetical protein